MKRAPRVVSGRKLLAQLMKYTLQLFHGYTYIYISLKRKEKERERENIGRYGGEGDPRVQKEKATSGDLSLAPRRARSINHIHGKNLPSKFCATAREARGSCSSRALDRDPVGGNIVVIAKESDNRRGEEEGTRKRGRPYWVLSLCIVFQTVSTPRPLFFSFPASLLLFHLSATSLSSSVVSLPLPFCLLRHEEHPYTPRGRGIRFHVYTQDGSDWPGLKPSQITP